MVSLKVLHWDHLRAHLLINLVSEINATAEQEIHSGELEHAALNQNHYKLPKRAYVQLAYI